MDYAIFTFIWIIVVYFGLSATYVNPALENDDQSVTTIKVVPSSNPVSSVPDKPPTQEYFSSSDEGVDQMPPKQSDTERKMAVRGMLKVILSCPCGNEYINCIFYADVILKIYIYFVFL